MNFKWMSKSIFPEKGGVHTAPNIDLDKYLANKDLQQTVTKRVVWRIAQSQYDPLGLLAPYTVKLKMVISEEGAAKRGWDDAAPPQTVENFHNAISGLRELRNIKFARSIHPDAKVKGVLSLLVFGHGSRDTYCAVTYARWPMADSSFQCRLISCKTRVAPRQKISIPRVKLMGLLLATRLARKITDSFRIGFSAIKFFTDSSAVLRMLHCHSDTF